jgi:hypothetical protein
MEEIFQVIAFIVFGIFVLARRFVKKKKLADQDQESQDGGGMKLPSWLEELVEGDEIQNPVLPQQEQAQTPPPEMEQREVEQPAVSANQPEPEKEPASSVPTSTSSTERKVADLPLSPKTFRQAIILSEILKPPKSVQK